MDEEEEEGRAGEDQVSSGAEEPPVEERWEVDGEGRGR